jgi:hypothetical protein
VNKQESAETGVGPLQKAIFWCLGVPVSSQRPILETVEKFSKSPDPAGIGHIESVDRLFSELLNKN